MVTSPAQPPAGYRPDKFVGAIVIDPATGATVGGSAVLADKSGTVTLGATAQVLMAANASRRGFWIQNQSSGDLWISSLGTAAATQPSLWLPAGAFYEPSAVPLTAISIYGATTGQAFAAREW